jgi:hypothetical protein
MGHYVIHFYIVRLVAYNPRYTLVFRKGANRMVRLQKDFRAPARIGLLLPWINGDSVSYEDACEAIWRFLEAPAQTTTARTSADHAGHTRVGVEGALRELYGYEGPDGVVERLPELRLPVTVRPAKPPKQQRSVSALRHAERRSYLGAGQYVVVAEPATLRDAVVYVLVRLLTAPGMATLVRCPAPAPNDWSRECGRWFVTSGQRAGRPAKYCSTACRVRGHSRRLSEKNRREMRQAKRRKAK